MMSERVFVELMSYKDKKKKKKKPKKNKNKRAHKIGTSTFSHLYTAYLSMFVHTYIDT